LKPFKDKKEIYLKLVFFSSFYECSFPVSGDVTNLYPGAELAGEPEEKNWATIS
jgi:hypothetical protein